MAVSELLEVLLVSAACAVLTIAAIVELALGDGDPTTSWPYSAAVVLVEAALMVLTLILGLWVPRKAKSISNKEIEGVLGPNWDILSHRREIPLTRTQDGLPLVRRDGSWVFVDPVDIVSGDIVDLSTACDAARDCVLSADHEQLVGNSTESPRPGPPESQESVGQAMPSHSVPTIEVEMVTLRGFPPSSPSTTLTTIPIASSPMTTTAPMPDASPRSSKERDRITSNFVTPAGVQREAARRRVQRVRVLENVRDALRNLQREAFLDRPESRISRLLKYTRWQSYLVLAVIAAVALVGNLVRAVADPDSAADRGDGTKAFTRGVLARLVYLCLPILPLAAPVLGFLMKLFGTAWVVCCFIAIESGENFQSWDLRTCATRLWRTASLLLRGTRFTGHELGMGLPGSFKPMVQLAMATDFAMNLGNMTVLCAVDKLGVVAEPELSTEELFMPNANSGVSLELDVEDDDEVVSKRLTFAESEWADHLMQLKPLALGMVLNTLSPIASSGSEAAAKLLEDWSPDLISGEDAALRAVAETVGFTDTARSWFSRRRAVLVRREPLPRLAPTAAHAAAAAVTIEFGSADPVMRAKNGDCLPVHDWMACVVTKDLRSLEGQDVAAAAAEDGDKPPSQIKKASGPPKAQLFSRGDLRLLLHSCAKYFDGSTLRPLTKEKKDQIMQVDRQWHRQQVSYTVGFAFKPLRDEEVEILCSGDDNLPDPELSRGADVTVGALTGIISDRDDQVSDLGTLEAGEVPPILIAEEFDNFGESVFDRVQGAAGPSFSAPPSRPTSRTPSHTDLVNLDASSQASDGCLSGPPSSSDRPPTGNRFLLLPSSRPSLTQSPPVGRSVDDDSPVIRELSPPSSPREGAEIASENSVGLDSDNDNGGDNSERSDGRDDEPACGAKEHTRNSGGGVGGGGSGSYAMAPSHELQPLPHPQRHSALESSPLAHSSSDPVQTRSHSYTVGMSKVTAGNTAPHSAAALSQDVMSEPGANVMLTVTTKDERLALTQGGVFLGMAVCRHRPRREVAPMIEDLRNAGVRFMWFSPENERKTKGFGARMGMETDWNCCISLQEDSVRGMGGAFRKYLHSKYSPGGFGRHSPGAQNDFLDRSLKLPRGVSTIRDHLKNVDNVPLLVPMFANCTAFSAHEMIRILQENDEVVCCLTDGDSLGALAAAQSDITIAVQLERYDGMMRCAREQGTIGAWASSLWIRRGSVSDTLLRVLGEARRVYQNTKMSFVFDVAANMMLCLAIFVGCACGSDILAGYQIFCLSFLTIPLLSLSLLGAPHEPDHMTRMPDKNPVPGKKAARSMDDPSGGRLRYATYFFVRSLPTAAFLVAVYAYLVHRLWPSELSVSFLEALVHDFDGEMRDSSDGSYVVARAQALVWWIAAYYCCVMSTSYMNRALSLLDTPWYTNLPWLASVVFLMTLQTVWTVLVFVTHEPSDDAFEGGALYDVPWLAYFLILVVWPCGVLVVDELVKRKDLPRVVRHQKRQRLEFNTKLGMHSPI
eukprot:Rmarinus@m.21979